MGDGFSGRDAGDVRWEVYHNKGTTFVYANSEAIALARFMAKYPDYQVRKVVRR